MSDQGVQLAVLTITATITVANAATAIEEAINANSQMTGAPNNPTDQLQPALAIGSTLTSQSGLSSLLERLDGFMRLGNLAAEVRGDCLVILPNHTEDINFGC